MNAASSPTQHPGWKVLAAWLAGASTLLYVCSRFVPCSPPVYHGEIEDSFIQYLHTAFLERVHFGRDFVFNFGPWGFLYGGYHPATYLLSVLLWLGLAVVFWWAGWLAARHFARNKLAAWLWLMAFAAVAGLPIFTFIEARLKALVVLLWLLHFFVEGRRSAAAQAALVVALGLASLIKFNVLVDTTLVLAVIALDDLVRRRRFPWLLPLFGASLLLFWVAAGQPLSGLGPFLRTVPLLTGGYTEATMLTGSTPLLDAGCFLLVAAMVCALGGYASWRRHRLFGAFALAGLGCLLFTAFKHANVRHDFHEAAAALDLLLVSLAALAVAWPIVRAPGWLRQTPPGGSAGVRPSSGAARSNQPCAPGSSETPLVADVAAPGDARTPAQSRWVALRTACVFLPTLAVFWFAAATFSRYFEQGLPVALLETFSGRNLLAPVKPLRDPGFLRAGYEAYHAELRNSTPLPPIQGSVDTYPGSAGALLAWGFDYRPRPVMQSLVAYTPELAEVNAAFLRSARAPANILFQLAPIDDHLPSLEDGRSWPELLTRYDVAEVEWSFLRLKRAAAPRPWRLEPLADQPIGFGDVVPIPAATNGPIWATIEIDKTLAGWIVSVLYKPPSLWLFGPHPRRWAAALPPGARLGRQWLPAVSGSPEPDGVCRVGARRRAVRFGRKASRRRQPCGRDGVWLLRVLPLPHAAALVPPGLPGPGPGQAGRLSRAERSLEHVWPGAFFAR